MAIPGQTDRELLFLDTCDDLEARIADGSDYALGKAAALLRQLLMNGSPLLVAANRRLRLKPIVFEVAAIGTDQWPEGLPRPSMQWVNLAEQPAGAMRRVDLNLFLKHHLAQAGNAQMRVQDVIDVNAHVRGGVHQGEGNAQQKKVLGIDDVMKITGRVPSLDAVPRIAAVALKGMSLLREALAREHRPPHTQA